MFYTERLYKVAIKWKAFFYLLFSNEIEYPKVNKIKKIR